MASIMRNKINLMKKLIVLSTALMISCITLAQKRDTEGLKKIEQTHEKEGVSGLAGLANLAQLAELSSLAELGELAELSAPSELSVLSEVAVDVDNEISVMIPEITTELSAELSKLPSSIDLTEITHQATKAAAVDYSAIIEEVMKELRKELKEVKKSDGETVISQGDDGDNLYILD